MKRRFQLKSNNVDNDGCILKSENQLDFLDKWLQIGGNYETKWAFDDLNTESPVVKIENTSTTHAGMIQTLEGSLDVGENKKWQIDLFLMCENINSQAYLRIFPIRDKGITSLPWKYILKPEVRVTEHKQVVLAGPDVNFLRLEIGVLGQGDLGIDKVITYPLSNSQVERRIRKIILIKDDKKNTQIKQIDRESRYINHIETIGSIIQPIQLAMPIPLKIPVNVQANVQADVRNLTPTRDKVQIYGSGQMPIATSGNGILQVEICGNKFHESLEEVKAEQTVLCTTTRDVSSFPNYSFAVYNFGYESAYVHAELSPDGFHWALEGNQQEVATGNLVIVSPNRFLRYSRLSYKADGPTQLKIWIQAQG